MIWTLDSVLHCQKNPWCSAYRKCTLSELYFYILENKVSVCSISPTFTCSFYSPPPPAPFTLSSQSPPPCSDITAPHGTAVTVSHFHLALTASLVYYKKLSVVQRSLRAVNQRSCPLGCSLPILLHLINLNSYDGSKNQGRHNAVGI